MTGIVEWLSSVLVPAALMLCGGFFLCYLRGGALRHPLLSVKSMLRPGRKGGVSPFRALTLALAGTLGVGNIVGVASALALGGPGAIFWMWVSALLAMTLKYAEIVLAMRTRKTDTDGTHTGGAMYYIRAAFGGRWAKFGAALAALFALLCIADALSMGCLIQVNAVAGAFRGVFGVPLWVSGLVLALLTALVVGRRASHLAFLTEWLVPLMSGGYLLLSIGVLCIRHDAIPEAFRMIFSGICTVRGVGGGVFGFLSLRAIRFGTMRGLLSNEAGCGTAPIAHAASDSDSPAEQGFLGIVEVFVDTILLCTMTALVILVSPEVISAYATDGVMMTVAAFGAVFGAPAAGFLAIAVLLFGFATVVCWSHYGAECVRYLSRGRGWMNVYCVLVVGFVFAGALAAPEAVWTIADVTLGCMTLINLFALCRMRREVRGETALYWRGRVGTAKAAVGRRRAQKKPTAGLTVQTVRR